MERRSVTIYDISKEANVSPATVSRVINGNGKVSEETRKLVLEKIEELDFKPNALARSLSNNRSHTIGFIVPDIKNPYFSSIYYEVEKEASMLGYTVLLANSKSDYRLEGELLDLFTQKRVDGIVFMGGRIDTNLCDNKYHQELIDLCKETPIVLTSKLDIPVPQVYADERSAAGELMEHLKSQGCRSVALLGGSEEINVSKWRRQFCRDACRKLDLRIRPEWVIDGSFSIQCGRESMAKLFSNVEMPDAVCCINDEVAVGALNYAASQGFLIPDNILLTGFDGSYMSDAVFPQITTVQCNYEEFGRRVFRLLLANIRKERCDLSITVNPRVVVRGSTRLSIKPQRRASPE